MRTRAATERSPHLRALIWLVRAFTDTETQCVSVERIVEYASLEPEEEGESSRALLAPPPNWPQAGRVQWRDVSLRYRPNLDPALRTESPLDLKITTWQCHVEWS